MKRFLGDGQQIAFDIENHCGVTYVNRLRRAGVPREAAMWLVNHSSELIHQIYQRSAWVTWRSGAMR